MKKSVLKSILALSTLSFAMTSYAIDVDSKDYLPAPLGTNVFLFYGQYANRDALYADGHKVAGNNKLESNIGLFRFVHYTEIAGIHMNPQVIIPVGQVKASKDTAGLGKTSGALGDIMLANTVMFLMDDQQQRYWGATGFLSLPTGSYDRDRALNMGENRYKFTLQTSFIQKITDKWGTDLTGDVTFYGPNHDVRQNQTLKQDLGYQLQADTWYQMSDRYDLRMGVSYTNAGKTKVNGTESDAAEQTKIWVGSQIQLSPISSLVLQLGRDLQADNNFKENFRFNFRYAYVF